MGVAMRRIGKFGWLPAGLAGTVLFMFLAGEAWPQEPAPEKPVAQVLPEGLRHVPPEAMAFAYFRCSDFLHSPLGMTLRKHLARDPESAGVLKVFDRELGVQ